MFWVHSNADTDASTTPLAAEAIIRPKVVLGLGDSSL